MLPQINPEGLNSTRLQANNDGKGSDLSRRVLKIDLTKSSSHRGMYDEVVQGKEIKACCVTF